jgi:alpha-1,6-mannosyltransferase
MQSSTTRKLSLLGLASTAVYGANFRLGSLLAQAGVLEADPHPVVSYLIQIIPLGVLYLWSMRVAARGREAGRTDLLVIVIFALLFRLPLIPLRPALSSDIYRYLWEGKVQAVAGINPYVHPPLDDRLASLRDQEIYPFINRKESPTVYPAGAQLLFAIAHRAGVESPQELKSLALVADVLTMLVLLLLLRELRLSSSRLIIYAWNPLLIYELFYSGHLESFMIPPVIGFVYLFLRGRTVGAGLALGLATALKLVPLFLLATAPRGKRLKVSLPLASAVGFAYFFYANAGAKILGFLPTYFSDPYEMFNLGIIQLALLWATKVFSLPPTWIRFALFACFITVLLGIARRPLVSPPDIVQKSGFVLSAHLLFIYPALHPWYLCPLIPFLCVLPSQAWIFFSLLLPLSYLKYLTADGTMPLWVTLTQFVPLYALLAAEFGRIGSLHERRYQWHLGFQTPFSNTF